MTLWTLFIVVLAVAARAQAQAVLVPSARGVDDVMVALEPQAAGGFQLTVIKGNDREVLAHIGRTLPEPYSIQELEDSVQVQSGAVKLTVSTEHDAASDARGIRIRWDAPTDTRLEDCIGFGSKQWYAGPMHENQYYPIQNTPRPYSPYVSTEVDNRAIVERYWLNSAGEYIYVYPEVPLFVDYNNLLPNHLCLGAQVANPYSAKREHNPLEYDIWILSDVKKAHKHAVKNYLGQLSELPNFRMVQHPIWSSWAQYAEDINESKLLEFAQEITDYGFKNSQLEIDDLWETCYGELAIDEQRFPDFAGFVEELKRRDYRVTIWIHPFINKNCEPSYSEALNNGYFAVNEDGDHTVTWWQSNGTTSGYIDFTNPEAAEWWYRRVQRLRLDYGIDSFKFDAGESSFAPQITVQNGDIDLQPHHIVDTFVRTCARFGNMIEVRTGFRTQELPIFVRMVDRDSIWGLNNGLKTVITTTLAMNLNGYSLVMPDMIGGNGFNLQHEQADLPTKELFIRWVQVNTFLPVMQFSFAPWNFDDETVEISRKFADLHAAYANDIFDAMKALIADGTPVNAPLWWVDPTDEEAQLIWDEFLLGEKILVAPVVEEGAVSRNIYLPKGSWLDGNSGATVQGPAWLNDYPAPLDTLPYFILQD